MPIEIMELIIKAKVSAAEDARQINGAKPATKPDEKMLESLEIALKEMANILKHKNER